MAGVEKGMNSFLLFNPIPSVPLSTSQIPNFLPWTWTDGNMQAGITIYWISWAWVLVYLEKNEY